MATDYQVSIAKTLQKGRGYTEEELKAMDGKTIQNLINDLQVQNQAKDKSTEVLTHKKINNDENL